jgi:hypothetical protein
MALAGGLPQLQVWRLASENRRAADAKAPCKNIAHKAKAIFVAARATVKGLWQVCRGPAGTLAAGTGNLLDPAHPLSHPELRFRRGWLTAKPWASHITASLLGAPARAPELESGFLASVSGLQAAATCVIGTSGALRRHVRDSESEDRVKSSHVARGCSILNHSALDGDRDARSGHRQKSTDS